MERQEFLYDQNSLLITIILFFLIILFNEIGYRIGRFVQLQIDSETKSLTGSVQASILGLLALLLGFTFNMSMQRYDNRSQALINEANAIGTAMLRVQLLPMQYQKETNDLLQKYVVLRIAVGKIDVTRQHEREKYNKDINEIQRSLWSLAILATRDDPRPVTTGVFVKSLNDVIDMQGKRNALLQLHVPEIVLILLFIVFIVSGGIIGYSSGLSGNRIVVPTVIVSLLISMVVFIIIDLDRPKRGLILVDQRAMLELRQGALQ